jgi:hypothetical protein
MNNPDRAVPATKLKNASGTAFGDSPEKIIAANAIVPSTVTTLDKAANDTSASAAGAANCLIRILSTSNGQTL